MPKATSVVAHFSLLSTLLVGCPGSPVGDPCLPEVIPEGGFVRAETYLETSSTQCKTRTCMVHQLTGDPRVECDPHGNPSGCVPREVRNNHVFCSCRCSINEGDATNVPLCACGDGFECRAELVTSGEPGVRGGYCVPCIEPGNPRDLERSLFDNCPSE